MIIKGCFACEINMRNGCPRCNFTGNEPITAREKQEAIFRAEEVLDTKKPKDAPVH